MHTPGPWFADSSFVGARSIDRFFIKCSSKDLPGGVAEAEANARLIAVAPDLLDALRQVQALLAIGTHLGGSAENFKQYIDTCNAIDAAIAAATGEPRP